MPIPINVEIMTANLLLTAIQKHLKVTDGTLNDIIVMNIGYDQAIFGYKERYYHYRKDKTICDLTEIYKGGYGSIKFLASCLSETSNKLSKIFENDDDVLCWNITGRIPGKW